MSAIEDIINRREMLADRGRTPNEYQTHLDLLAALNVLTDNLDRIATALEIRNSHDGIIKPKT